MAEKNKLQKLLEIFSPDETSVDFSEFDKSIDQLKSGLKEKIQARTLDDVNGQLDRFTKKINFEPLYQAARNLESSIEQKITKVSELMDGKVGEFKQLLQESDTTSTEKVAEVASTIEELRQELQSLNDQKNGELNLLKNNIASLQDFNNTTTKSFDIFNQKIQLIQNDTTIKNQLEDEVQKFNESLEKVRKELTNRIGNLQFGGGNANRNITIGGNASTLSKYTDINLKAGSNVTITYANNNTTKQLDVTIAATGGGGGTTRLITTVSVSSVIAAIANTDQVLLANGGIQLTLPTAVSDTSQYTIKNIGTSSVLVNTTSAQTIDNDTTIIMPIRYTSVDIISDSSNWNIT